MATDIEPLPPYEELNRIQKLAVFLVAIGPEAAGKLLVEFDPPQMEAICKQMAHISVIEENLQNRVKLEIGEVLRRGKLLLHGGQEYVQKTLLTSQSPSKAFKTLVQILPDSIKEEPFMKELAAMDVLTIYNFLSNEQPQTIAFVASRLSTEKAVQVLQKLPASLKEAVLEKIGTMGPSPVDYSQRIVEGLKRKLAQSEHVLQEAGGVQNVADILNGLPKDLSKELLMRLEEKNETLGKAVRRKMFGFEDLIKLSIPDLQRIMREVETADLVIAMKPASPKLQQALFASVSKRAAETLKEEIQMLGAVKVKDIEAAQDRIIQIVRRLEDAGDITLDASS
jgi:flagellar motor switch protein FliG